MPLLSGGIWSKGVTLQRWERSRWWQLLVAVTVQQGRRLEFLGLRGVKVTLKFLRLSVLDRVLLSRSVDTVSDFNGDL